MSGADRLAKARSRQGKLSDVEMQSLTSDLLLLLDGKRNPQTVEELTERLVKLCGWERHRIHGPRPYVHICLNNLEREGKIQSDSKATGEMPEVSIVSFYWKCQ